jgi:hypothetical protein
MNSTPPSRGIFKMDLNYKPIKTKREEDHETINVYIHFNFRYSVWNDVFKLWKRRGPDAPKTR